MSATADAADRRKLVLITGLSGSGKSTAAKAFEDLGYYVVDNLPLSLLRTLVDDPARHVGDVHRIAIVTDVRAPRFAEEAPSLAQEIDGDGETVILFLEAAEEVLVRRFSETRRAHPLAVSNGAERSLLEGIRLERQLLSELRGGADLVFDTSDWSVHDVRRAVYRQFEEEDRPRPSMQVTIVTFGFKHGMPAGSDLVFDVRFLPNPHFIPGLREQTGCDAPVREFMEAQEDYGEFVGRLHDFLLFLLPRYRTENRSYLTVAIGCTGGRHRSVAIGEEIARRLGRSGWAVRLTHRDSQR